LTLAILLMAAVGCKKSPLTEQEAAGQHLYNRSCAHCHEENDLGLKKLPPNLHHVFGDQTLASGAPATDDQVKRTILEGKGLMPPFKDRFNPVEMQQLLAYLHHGVQ
jgi:mono/diheme cytochrome c family protein